MRQGRKAAEQEKRQEDRNSAQCERGCCLTGGLRAHHSCHVTLQPQTLLFLPVCSCCKNSSRIKEHSFSQSNAVTATDAAEQEKTNGARGVGRIFVVDDQGLLMTFISSHVCDSLM